MVLSCTIRIVLKLKLNVTLYYHIAIIGSIYHFLDKFNEINPIKLVKLRTIVINSILYFFASS